MSGMLINLIIQIVSGAIGGNVIGAASRDMSLGAVGNSIAGAIGGGIGGQVLGAFIPLLANTARTIDVGAPGRLRRGCWCRPDGNCRAHQK